MLIDSMLQRCGNRGRSRQVVLAVASAIALSLPLAASAQDKLEPIPSLPIPPQIKCGADVKAQLAQALSATQDAPEGDQLAAENDLYAKYQSCVEDAKLIPTANFYLAARECSAAVSHAATDHRRSAQLRLPSAVSHRRPATCSRRVERQDRGDSAGTGPGTLDASGCAYREAVAKNRRRRALGYNARSAQR